MLHIFIIPVKLLAFFQKCKLNFLMLKSLVVFICVRFRGGSVGLFYEVKGYIFDNSFFVFLFWCRNSKYHVLLFFALELQRESSYKAFAIFLGNKIILNSIFKILLGLIYQLDLKRQNNQYLKHFIRKPFLSGTKYLMLTYH